MDVPRDVDVPALKERLETIASELCVDVGIEPQEA
jgi:hypothetical protein